MCLLKKTINLVSNGSGEGVKGLHRGGQQVKNSSKKTDRETELFKSSMDSSKSKQVHPVEPNLYGFGKFYDLLNEVLESSIGHNKRLK